MELLEFIQENIPNASSLQPYQILDIVNTYKFKRLQNLFINERSIYSRIGAADGEFFLSTATTFSTSNSAYAPMVKRGLSWLDPSREGVNIADAATQGLLAVLAGVNATMARIVDALNEACSEEVTFGPRYLNRELTVSDIILIREQL